MLLNFLASALYAFSAFKLSASLASYHLSPFCANSCVFAFTGPLGVAGASLGFSPQTYTVSIGCDNVAFTYDRAPHSPDIYFVNQANNNVIYVKYTLVGYTSDDTGYDSTDAPKDPFYYAMSISIDETYTFTLSGNSWLVFHIDEAADGSDFVADWAAARTAGAEEGMCSMLANNDKKAGLSNCITAIINLCANSFFGCG